MNWEAIASAYSLVLSSAVKRVDGDGWKVYRVTDDQIRVDIAVPAPDLQPAA